MKLLKFYADWCQPCKQLDTALDELLPNYDYIDLEKVNIEEQVDLTRKYLVRSIPTLMFVSEDGKPIETFRGFGNTPDSKEKLNKFLALQV